VKKDIVIRCSDGELQSRTAIYPGTTRYREEVRFGSQIYRNGAFLPRGDARRATPLEIETLTDDRTVTERNRIIGIVGLSTVVLNALRAAKVDEGKIPDDALQKYPYTQLSSELAPRWIVRSPLRALGYASYPAGFHTVTFDAANSRFIGLHIDDLDALPIDRREDSTTRLCINLGDSARYLLFINLSASSMARAVGGDAMQMRSTPLIHAFMNSFPDYPVARLEIRPGEAYIAPTENMIHDGSTLGMSSVDHQVTLRGIIDPIS